MAVRINKYIYLALAIALILAAVVLENGLLYKHPETALINRFQKKLQWQETELESHLKAIKKLAETPGFTGNYLTELAPYNEMLEKKGIGFLIYRYDSIYFWSDRAIAFRNTLPLSVEPESVTVLFPNGYYLSRMVEAQNFKIFGLILIKNNYAHENQYLTNSFAGNFVLPPQFKILKAGAEKGYPIYNRNGEAIFSIQPQGENFCSPAELYLAGFLFMAGILFLLVFMRRQIASLNQGFATRLLITGCLLFLMYWLHIILHIPRVFDQYNLFSPSYFALSDWLPSLGDFFLASAFFFYFMLMIYRDLRINQMERNSGIPGIYLIVLLILGAGGTYLLIDHFIRELIYNSTFSFTLNHINEITLHTAFGLASVMLLLFGLILLTIRIVEEARRTLSIREIMIVAVLAAVFLALILFLLKSAIAYRTLLLFLFTVLLTALYTLKTKKKYGLTYLIFFVAVMTLYSLEIIYRITVEKERDTQKLMAMNLVAEHDPAAEVFLAEIQQQINVDPNIPRYLFRPFNNLEVYLEQTYFSGFFRQYDLQITICDGSDSVLVSPQNIMEPCFPFFEKIIAAQGIPLPGTNFYYLDNMNGRISYFGKLHYPLSSDSIGVSIFMELHSKIQSEGIGFPELLIDKSMRKPASYERFDYAKYYGGELVDRRGEYKYNYYIYSYDFGDTEFSFNTWDGYEHLVYCTKGDNFVIVSRSLYTFIDYLISFPYLFVFYFGFSLLTLLLIQPSFRRKKIKFDLKLRIQAAIISIVFVSLLLVAIGTILYNLKEYKSKLQADLDDKMTSISVEIDNRLQDVDRISPELEEWLTRELIKLSNIFRTDINIYGVNGALIVSSRPEIFNKGLVSTKISSFAYFELYENYQTNYFQPEKIGKLSYFSAYSPIINNNGDYLGFINLPYFTNQDKYSQEISTFIVAFINLYVLLFLASILIALFIANQITLPLVAIRENLRKIELGKRNEPIRYPHDDEIGKLVKEYNKKVDELAVSAELLARSERESAWREMAKQVAHEIKNPLTPMKLNIQHLQRFKGTETEYLHFLGRVTQTLIDQIDTLSDIATEFSNFAQIPTARKQVFNLAAQIKKLIELYENNDNVTISFEPSNYLNLLVNADREQLSRALINLIKNGIQSIPEGQIGKIDISIGRNEHMALIIVADNGTGIPEDLHEKMFSPNFTTKSSGMGLGLAIVKNIVENFNGRIGFETKPNEGTTFTLEIPIYEENMDSEPD